MSINHFSPELQETLWWSTQHQKPSSAAAAATPWPYHQANWPKPLPYDQRPLGLNLNYCDQGDVEDAPTTTMEDEEELDELNKQHLFEKPLTPSDVGKLNRLVIPKQHAEKYFPLGADSGLLLAFEDECGKCWRFRYSYWSSSQSYVLTKGWSRYVKDKQLDAGDVILFERHRIDSDRLFIGWRRRGEDSAAAAPSSIKEGGGGGGGGSARVQQLQVGGGGVGEAAAGGGANWTRDFYSTHYSYPAHHVPSLPDHQHHRLSPSEPEEQESRNLLPSGGGGNSRRLRLFGVNLECQMDESEPSTMQEEDSSQGLPLFSQSPSYSSSSTLYQQQYRHHQTDITFYQDVNHCHHRNFRDGRG